MRVALVTSAFRARSPIDLVSHVRSLAPALARAGATVEVFAGTAGSGLVPYAQRRIEVAEPVTGQTFGVTMIELEPEPDQARVAESFAAFLGRERPRVCHFEQLDPMGVGLVREAKKRRVATLYSAHDTWPAHDRTTLTLPDLSPFELGDTEAEARSIAAEAILADEGLREGEATFDERLTHLLHEDLTDPAEASALREAREAIEVRRAQKRVALSGVDRRFAASRLLSRELSAAVGRAFTFRAPGVDKAVLAAAAADTLGGPSSAESDGALSHRVESEGAESEGAESDQAGPTLERAKGPLRLVYLGTTEPTSGLSVLLDAVSRIRADKDGPALSLRLALERTDDARDAEMHARAQLLRVDVVWSRGCSVDPLGALQGADLVVLPSLWGEVAPSTLRLALAAGVPAVASRMPGVVEAAPSTACVLVTPGSVDSLTEALTRLGGDGGAAALKSMRSAALSEREVNTKNIDDEAQEWMDTYRSLVESADALDRARARRRASVGEPESQADSLAGQQPFGAEAPPEPKRPAALVEVEEQIVALQQLSNTELFARAQAGIVKLRHAFGLKDTDAELLARVVSRGGALRDRAEHDDTTRREVARALEELKVAQAALRSDESVRSRRIADLQKVLEQYEHEVNAREKEAAQARAAMEAAESLNEEAVAQKEAAEAVAKELQATRSKVSEEAEDARQRYREVAIQVEAAKSALSKAESARDRLAHSIEERGAEVRALRERVVKPSRSEGEAQDVEPATGAGLDVTSDLESIEAYCVSLERDLDALRRNDEWVAKEADQLIESIGAVSAPAQNLSESDADAERMISRLGHVSAELDWRRREMDSATEAARSIRARFLAGPLASRLRSWGQPPADVVVSMTALAEVSSRKETGNAQHASGAADRAPSRERAAEPEQTEEPAAALPAGSNAGSNAGAASREADAESASGDSAVSSSTEAVSDQADSNEVDGVKS